VEPDGRESHLFTVGVDDRLVFEREPFAKWAVSGAELRILAFLILLVRRKMSDPIPLRFPWGMIATSIGIVLIAGGVVWFASLIEWSSLAPSASSMRPWLP
jgi:hypothetical protein